MAISPSHALYFLLQTKLNLLINEVLDQLYRPFVVTKPWAHVEGVISALSDKLEKWRFSLPSVFDFSKKQRDRQFARQRMSLGFFFYSTIILITRPCLCRVDPKIANLSGISGDFNQETRIKCVRAAKDMLDLLPNELSPINLYKVAPWWCLVHHLVQSATVSMLELSFRPDHHPQQVEETLQSAKKAVKFLRSMAEVDPAAHRAWGLCEDMLHKVANMVGQPFDSLPYGNLLDNSVGGGDGNSSTFKPSAEAGNFGEFFAPFQPTEGLLNQEGCPQEGFSQEGFPQEGFSQERFPQERFSQERFRQERFPQERFSQEGFTREGFPQEGYSREGFPQAEFSQAGFPKEGFYQGVSQGWFPQEWFSQERFFLQAQIPTSNDEFFSSSFLQPSFLHSSILQPSFLEPQGSKVTQSPSNFLSMFPSLNQIGRRVDLRFRRRDL
jgi:hypothetical protein